MGIWDELQYLGYVQTIVTVAMVVDAYRRSAEWFWYLVIIVPQPVGPWVYLALVVLGSARNPLRGRGGWSWKRRPSIDELRYRAQRTPTLMNHYTLAERLIEKDRYEEAVTQLLAAVALDPEYCPAQYALAVCHHERRECDKAVEPLEKIIARDRKWSNYRAWRLLIEVRSDLDNKAEALAACRELTKMMPTFENKCLLAEHLMANELRDETCKLLEQALEDHRFAPFGIRWRDRRWARQAHRLWREASQ
jgi:hypothetical protein